MRILDLFSFLPALVEAGHCAPFTPLSLLEITACDDDEVQHEAPNTAQFYRDGPDHTSPVCSAPTPRAHHGAPFGQALCLYAFPDAVRLARRARNQEVGGRGSGGVNSVYSALGLPRHEAAHSQAAGRE